MKITLHTLIADTQKKLEAKLEPRLAQQYAWWLIESITHKHEIDLITQQEVFWSADYQQKLEHMINQFLHHNMPLAYLLGSVPFCGLEIIIEPPILIPRPETEEWTAALIEKLQKLSNTALWILDLCTGSGCIALALADALPKAKIYGTDINDHALMLAKENARHNHISNVEFIRSDLFNDIPSHFIFDLIVGNPPYIAHNQWQSLEPSVTQWEDKQALLAADDGMALIKKIIDRAPTYIKKNGELQDHHIPQLILEMDINQGTALTAYMQQHKYNEITIKKDLEGKDRVISGRVDNVGID